MEPSYENASVFTESSCLTIVFFNTYCWPIFQSAHGSDSKESDWNAHAEQGQHFMLAGMCTVVNFRTDHTTNYASGPHPSMGRQWSDKGVRHEKVSIHGLVMTLKHKTVDSVYVQCCVECIVLRSR